jgi:membrane-associated phospholipid phosphatase
MTDLLWNLIPSGYSFLLSMETIRSGFFDLFFVGITYLLSAPGVVATFSVVYWCFNKRIGRGVVYAMLFSMVLNQWLKDLWHIPRPYDPALEPVLNAAGIREHTTPLLLVRDQSAAFPSGHAQGVVVLWGYLAASFRRGWLWLLSLFLILTIAFSRIYVGVHFLQDVIAGLIIGTIWLLVWLFLENRLRLRLSRLNRLVLYLLAVTTPLALLPLHPVPDTAIRLGTLSGLGVGFILEGDSLQFSPVGPWWQRLLRAVLGLALIFGFYTGFSLIIDPYAASGSLLLTIWTVLSLALLGFIIAWLLPWLFLRLGLMHSIRDEGQSF